ncbi:MAG: HlyD family type I secretion periplasmic adaptor subunit [Candidatus Competibacteraceae bacterium]|nr:HlyD family type I secretion periplasmic adaptor subunit [Candidatus Competibacteraceae bacterium]
MTARQSKAAKTIRRHLWLGLVAVLVLVAGVGGWAAATSLSGAVIATGTLVVDSYVKRVQHPSGGIVAEVLVKNGQRVEGGDVVVRLDDTQTRANLAIVLKRLDELTAREARLAAERDGLTEIAFPREFAARVASDDIRVLLAGESRLFEARRTFRVGRKSQLRERIAQLRQEIEGLDAQVRGKDREIVLINKELQGVRELWSKGHVSITRLNSLERDAARLEGERGALIAAAAQAKGKIAETELQILQVDEELQTEVAKEIREIQGQTGEFVERRIAAEDQLKRIDIRAPQNGIIHELAVHSVGAVINAGEAIMLVVPVADSLIGEVKVAPQDIDQLTLGQLTIVRFSAFNQQTTPELNGLITRIGADLTHDTQTGFSYYVVRVAIAEREIARLGNLQLVPGMPIEAFIQTGERTVLSYLAKPLTDQIARAFREE